MTGFRRGRGDDMGPAEATGWLQVGDRLVAINEIPLHDKNLMDTAQVRSPASPLPLYFGVVTHSFAHSFAYRFYGLRRGQRS